MDRSAGGLTLDVIRTLEGIDAAREDWMRLSAVCTEATPFQAWAWNRGLAEAGGRRLRVLVARDPSGRAVGVAPFQLRPLGMPGLSVLELIGGRVSDYLDVLAEESWRPAFAERLRGWLAADREWAIVHLRNLRAGSLGLLDGAGAARAEPVDVCPYALLPESPEAFETMLPGSLRRAVKGGPAARLAREGRLAFSVARDADEVRRDLPVFFALHQLRQRSKGERGRFFDPHWRGIFMTMSLALLDARILRLGVVRIDGRPAAAMYNMRVRDREYFYSTGMEPALAKYRPGSLLHHHLICEAIRDGVHSYDFGRGNEPYKAQWTNARCELFDLRLARSPVVDFISRRGELWRRWLTRSRTLKRVYGWTVGRRHASGAGSGDGS